MTDRSHSRDVKTNVFRSAWWLANSHLQTIWPVLSRRKINLPLRRERLELPDGDFLDLDWMGSNSDHIVLVLHGLGGSVNSPYAQGILKVIATFQWQGVFMHFRGCSHEHNRLPRSYHSGETEDLKWVINEIMRRFPNAKLSVIGFSLGGNVLLKWLGEEGKTAAVTCAIAVSVPFELNKVANRMRSGISRFYQWWLLRQLKQDIIEKFKDKPSVIDLGNLKKLRTFWEFDDKVTAPLHGFINVDHYYKTASSRQYLKAIAIPTLIIHAKDDPFMTPDAIPKVEEISKDITLELTESGGHVGFISGSIPGRSKYWLEERIPRFIQEYI